MAELGYASILIAFALAIISVLASLAGVRVNDSLLVAAGRLASWAIFACMSAAMVMLWLLLLTHDFQVKYVHDFTSGVMPGHYTFAAFWAGNAGSLMFMTWVLSGFAAAVTFFNRKTKADVMPYATAVMLTVVAMLTSMLVFKTHPFVMFPFKPAEGLGLNPILENPFMVIHPPLLLSSFMAFSVPFALTIGALAVGKLDKDWLGSVRRWGLLAWLISGVGNLLGMIWAYNELDLAWGGYWGWDPVENAAIIPWFLGTAFIHSLVLVKQRKDMMKAWSVFLILATFNLAFYGTFLGRTGFLQSVHTFGASGLGPYLLAFVIGMAVLSLGMLYAKRRVFIPPMRTLSWFSKESAFFLNNLLLVGIAVVIFWGTLFPVVYELITGKTIVVNASFYNKTLTAPMIVLLLLMGIGPFMGWRATTPEKAKKEFTIPLMAGALVIVALIASGVGEWIAVVGFGACAVVVASVFQEWVVLTRWRMQKRRESIFKAFKTLMLANRSKYGGYVVHLGVIVMGIGIIASSFFSVTATDSLAPGERLRVSDRYEALYRFPSQDFGRDRDIFTAEVDIVKTGTEEVVTTAHPKAINKLNFGLVVIEPDIKMGFLEDIKVVMVQLFESDVMELEVQVKPMVMWIWIGGGIIFFGGMFAFWPENKNRKTGEEQEAEGELTEA